MSCDISIVTIVNNNKTYNKFLENLEAQENVNYELIKIENINNVYPGARIAFNNVIEQINGRYIFFMHPDIRFLSGNALSEICMKLDQIADFGIIGVAGCPIELKNNKREIYTTILHGTSKKKAGISFENHVEVQTVDECLFILKKEVLKLYPFPNIDGWHLYAVEQCLLLKEKGFKNYVVPANLWHISDGKSLDANYVVQLKRILKKYSNYKYINTTVRKWPTSKVYMLIGVNLYYLKQKLKSTLKKRG